MTEKKTRKAAGRPSKVKVLLQEKNWKKLVELTRRGLPLTVIATILEVDQDTIRATIRAKDAEIYPTFKEFQKAQNLILRAKVLAKYHDRVLDDEVECSDKLLIHAAEKLVFEKEKEEAQQVDTGKPKIVYVPITDFANEEELALATEKQQEDLMERMQEHMAKNGLEGKDDA